jgi:hypothetical protein
VKVLRRPRPGVVEPVRGLTGSGIGEGDGDLDRATDDLVGASRRERFDAGGTFSALLLLQFLASKPTTGMRLCLLALRSARGAMLEVDQVLSR